MVFRAKLSSLKQGHWYESVVRFALGGLATVVAGMVAKWLGLRSGWIVSCVFRNLLRERGLHMKSPVVKRSIVVASHKTSVSLGESFWNGMKEISLARQVTLSELTRAAALSSAPSRTNHRRRGAGWQRSFLKLKRQGPR